MESGSDIVNAAAPLLSTVGGIADSRDAYKYSKKLANYQNKLNIENWKMVNEYNSPESVMARYEAAGLNRNLIYGNGTVTPAQPLGSPSFGSVKQNTSGAGAVLAQSSLAAAQMRNMQVTNDNLREDTKIKSNQAESLRLDNLMKVLRMPQIDAETRRMLAAAVVAEVEAKYAEPFAAQEFSHNEKTIELQGSEIDKVEAEIKNLNANELETLSRAALNDANAALAKANISVSQAQAKYYIQQAINAAKEGKLLEWRVNLTRQGVDPNLDPAWRMFFTFLDNWFGFDLNRPPSSSAFNSFRYSAGQRVGSMFQRAGFGLTGTFIKTINRIKFGPK